jgi:hypothetical protein
LSIFASLRVFASLREIALDLKRGSRKDAKIRKVPEVTKDSKSPGTPRLTRKVKH